MNHPQLAQLIDLLKHSFRPDGAGEVVVFEPGEFERIEFMRWYSNDPVMRVILHWPTAAQREAAHLIGLPEPEVRQHIVTYGPLSGTQATELWYIVPMLSESRI